jgi:hypothetical protein
MVITPIFCCDFTDYICMISLRQLILFLTPLPPLDGGCCCRCSCGGGFRRCITANAALAPSKSPPVGETFSFGGPNFSTLFQKDSFGKRCILSGALMLILILTIFFLTLDFLTLDFLILDFLALDSWLLILSPNRGLSGYTFFRHFLIYFIDNQYFNKKT